MADAFTGSNYYKRSLTEYEVEACKRDVADAHTFTAATAMAAKIERRAELDAEIAGLEAEIAAVKTKHADTLAAKDAEITALMVEIAAAKTKRNHKLAAMDAEIAELEAEIAASKTKRNRIWNIVINIQIIIYIFYNFFYKI